jgi:hypothetical protein
MWSPEKVPEVLSGKLTSGRSIGDSEYFYLMLAFGVSGLSHDRGMPDSWIETVPVTLGGWSSCINGEEDGAGRLVNSADGGSFQVRRPMADGIVSMAGPP